MAMTCKEDPETHKVLADTFTICINIFVSENLENSSWPFCLGQAGPTGSLSSLLAASFGVHFICLKFSQSALHQKTTHLFKFHTASALRSRMSCRATGQAPSVVLPRPSGIVDSLPKSSWELPHWSEPGLRFRKLTGRLYPCRQSPLNLQLASASSRNDGQET